MLRLSATVPDPAYRDTPVPPADLHEPMDVL